MMKWFRRKRKEEPAPIREAVEEILPQEEAEAAGDLDASRELPEEPPVGPLQE